MDVSGNISAILNQKGRGIFSVSPNDSVFDAVSLLSDKNIGALLVMDGEKLVGMLSERDYTRKVMLRGKRSRETTVAEIMSTDLKVVSPREAVEDCLRLMTDKRIACRLNGGTSLLATPQAAAKAGLVPLQLPDGVAVNNRAHGSSFEFPS